VKTVSNFTSATSTAAAALCFLDDDADDVESSRGMRGTEARVSVRPAGTYTVDNAVLSASHSLH